MILIFLGGYFALLMGISFWTNRKTTGESFYTGDHQSPWIIVAFGLIGTSMSGVTMVSVTGKVVSQQWQYMQIVMGYVVGYFLIAYVLLPLYYRLNLASIYHYLGIRFGIRSQHTGSFYFILSRSLGAAARLYLAVMVMHSLVFHSMGLPFWATILIIIALIFIYTAQGGIKTIVWTDTLQSGLLLVSVILSIVALLDLLDYDFFTAIDLASNNGFTEMVKGPGSFTRDFISGILICLTMTGLDQGMMQRSLSCRSLSEARKNILSFSGAVVLVNLLFMTIGAFIALYMINHPIPHQSTDTLFPYLAQHVFPPVVGGLFIIGMIAATFSSADDAMTALTTTISLDMLGLDMKEKKHIRYRHWVHVGVGLMLFAIIMLFLRNSGQAIIDIVLGAGSITYGPLLGLFAFGMFTKRKVGDQYVPWIAVMAPIAVMLLCIYAGHLAKPDLIIDSAGAIWKLLFTAVGTEIIAYIGSATFLLLWLFSTTEEAEPAVSSL